MHWWKRLKTWQQAGLIVGGIHLAIYVTLYLLTSGSMGILLLYDIEIPWLIIVSLFFGEITWSGSKVELLVIGMIGTTIYSIAGMAITLLVKFRQYTGKQGQP